MHTPDLRCCCVVLCFVSRPLLRLPFLITSPVYGWLLERLPTMKSMQVCNAVFAMGKLNLYNAELCDALLQVRERGEEARTCAWLPVCIAQHLLSTAVMIPYISSQTVC